ncbi:ricin-type beta-trefoil lectin domain protein [Labrys portucalensis]|uniref:Alpha-galactosidase n=1 Tax=Labrys neptuniae TaxID=376174 RepID=A0ABV6ZRP5_9HYPH
MASAFLKYPTQGDNLHTHRRDGRGLSGGKMTIKGPLSAMPMLIFLAACGGGDDGGNTNSTFADPVQSASNGGATTPAENKTSVVVSQPDTRGASPVTPATTENTIGKVSGFLAPTPPMGFTTWSRFKCSRQSKLGSSPKLQPVNGINAPLNDDNSAASYSFQHFMLDQAQAIKDSGLQAAGYTYINVDDCWMDQARDAQGNLQGGRLWIYGNWDPKNLTQKGFDRDLSSYVSYLHGMGFKAGLYSSSGYRTCQIFPASAEHETVDAEAFARWKIDYLKYDNCDYDKQRDTKDTYQYWPADQRPTKPSDHTKEQLFTRMSQALRNATTNSDTKILFEESAPANFLPQSSEFYNTMEWVRSLGELWRIGGDIKNYELDANTKKPVNPWVSEGGYAAGVYPSFYSTVALSRYVAPGRWNDADQVLIGDNGMTNEEERSQLSLWSILGAPLFLTTDVRRFTQNHALNPEANEPVDMAHLAESLKILTNRDVISVDQDPLGAGGYIAWQTDASFSEGIDVITKPLSGDRVAIVVLNKSDTSAQTQTVSLPRIGLSSLHGTCSIEAKNLWTGKVTTRKISVGGIQSSEPHSVQTDAIPAHGSAMYVVSATCDGENVQVLPTGQIYARPDNNSKTGGLCLTADNSGLGSKLHLAKCTGADEQVWQRDKTAHRLRLLAKPDLCVAFNMNGTASLNTCSDGDQTQNITYYLNGMFANHVAAGDDLKRPDASNCLDITMHTYNAGTIVGSYKCGSSSNQVNQIWSGPGTPG